MAEIRIKLFGKPEVTVDGEAVELSVELPTLAVFILWRNRGNVDADTLVDVLKPRSKAETDRTSFIKKHKTTLRQLLHLELPATLKLTTIGPAILEQAWVDVVEFDRKIASADRQELEEALELRRRGPLLVTMTDPDIFAKERTALEEKYQEALWRLFQENSRMHPAEAVGFANLLLGCPDLPENRAVFLQEQRRKLEHELFVRETNTGDDKTTRATRLLRLPHFPTELIGREAETNAVQEMLFTPGLVTLTGNAGIGKTRIAAAVARRLQENFPAGAEFIDLTTAGNAEQIVGQISTGLGLTEETGRARRETLLAFLEDKNLLLVWDNCEHLAAVCALLAADVLRRCPAIRILATSRESLRAYGERLYHVPVLPDESAVRLFLARAHAVNPDFQITQENRATVLKICRDLDGLPLALELAAALMDVRAVNWIADNLHRRFAVLVGGSRAGSPRHASLQVAFDLSYDLLPPAEQALFRALGVFAGTFSLDAVEAVAGAAAAPDAAHLLTQLVRKSLVIAEEQAQEMRFRLLASTEHYAKDRLREQGEWEETGRRHRDFFLALAEEADPKLKGPDQKHWLDRLETEVYNLRAALSWCEDRPERNEEEAEKVKRTDTYLHLSGLLLPLWQMRGHLSEGRNWLDRALRQCKEVEVNGHISALSAPKGEALWAAGVLALLQSDYNAAQALSEESLVIGRQLGILKDITASLKSLGNVAMRRGDGMAATALFKECLSISRQMENQQAIAGALNNLGLALRDQGDLDEATGLFQESLTIRRQLGNPEDIAASLNNLGMLTAFQGNYADGVMLLEESLTIFRQLQDQHGIAHTLRALGSLALMQRDFGLAKTLLEESLPILRQLEDLLHLSVAHCSLGGVALQQGDCRLAREHFREGLRVFRKIGSPIGIAYSLEGYSAVTHTENQLSMTAKLIGAAQAYRLALGLPLPPIEQKEASIQIAEVQEAMGVEAFEVALAEGRAMSWEQAVAFALGEAAP